MVTLQLNTKHKYNNTPAISWLVLCHPINYSAVHVCGGARVNMINAPWWTEIAVFSFLFLSIYLFQAWQVFRNPNCVFFGNAGDRQAILHRCMISRLIHIKWILVHFFQNDYGFVVKENGRASWGTLIKNLALQYIKIAFVQFLSVSVAWRSMK